MLFALALLAVFTLSSTMLTRIGVGVLIALALDPLVGDWVQDQDLSTKTQRWIDELPERFTDQRLAESAGTLVSGVVSVATVVVVSITQSRRRGHLAGRGGACPPRPAPAIVLAPHSRRQQVTALTQAL